MMSMKDKMSGVEDDDMNSFFKNSENETMPKKHFMLGVNNLEDMHSATDVHQNTFDI